MEVKYTEFNIEIYFDEFPEENIRETLKAYRWRWNDWKKCWHARKTQDNMELVELLKKTCDCKEEEEDIRPVVTIRGDDIIVRSNGFYCGLHHDVEDVEGKIIMHDRHGDIFYRNVPLALCHNCGCYFILEETYKRLKLFGVIGCRVMNKKEFAEKDLDLSGWKEKSILKQWGYSVNKEDDLSDEQRRSILIYLIRTGVLSKDRVLSYLDFFISNIHPNENSVYLWKSDRRFIEEYSFDGVRKVIIN